MPGGGGDGRAAAGLLLLTTPQQLIAITSKPFSLSLPVIGKIIDEKVTERNDCLLLKVLTRISTKLMQCKQHFGAYPTH